MINGCENTKFIWEICRQIAIQYPYRKRQTRPNSKKFVATQILDLIVARKKLKEMAEEGGILCMGDARLFVGLYPWIISFWIANSKQL